jgi:hypothetical protein
MVNRVEEKRIIKERNEKRKYRDEIQIYTTSSGDTCVLAAATSPFDCIFVTVTRYIRVLIS